MIKIRCIVDTFEKGISYLTMNKIYEANYIYNGEEIVGYEIKNDIGVLSNHAINLFEVLNKPIEWTDAHYSFIYKLKKEDIDKGEIKIDPYFVSREWKLGSKDETGILFHILKTIARFGLKNTVKREVDAIFAQATRLKQLNNN